MLSAKPGVQLHRLAPEFLALLEHYARLAEEHRYRVPIIVTSAVREHDRDSAHAYGRAIDIRTQLPGWESPGRQLKLVLYLAALWAAVAREHGYDCDEWGIGYYGARHPDGAHLHLDVRPHVSRELYAATWVEGI